MVCVNLSMSFRQSNVETSQSKVSLFGAYKEYAQKCALRARDEATGAPHTDKHASDAPLVRTDKTDNL